MSSSDDGPAMIALGECFACHRLFGFNPVRVPSYQGEPICEDCMAQANRIRREAGRPEWPILPGAYDPEPAP